MIIPSTGWSGGGGTKGVDYTYSNASGLPVFARLNTTATPALIASTDWSSSSNLNLGYGQHYHVKVVLQASTPVLVTVQLRHDNANYEGLAVATTQIGTAATTVEIDGIYPASFASADAAFGSPRGSLQIMPLSSATITVNSAEVDLVQDNPMGSQAGFQIPDTFFGVHLNKLTSAGDAYVDLGQQVLRVWDAGAQWSAIEPFDGCLAYEQCWAGGQTIPGTGGPQGNCVSHLVTEPDGNGGTKQVDECYVSPAYRLQAYVGYAQAHNLKVLYELGQTPTWDALGPTNTACYYGAGACTSPTDVNSVPPLVKWRRYINTVATRFKGQIKYWELWNEFDGAGFWSGTPQQMVSLAAVAYDELKNVDPTNVVIGPSTSSAGGLVQLSQFYAMGGSQYVDIVSTHSSWTPDTLTLPSDALYNVRGMMNAQGLSSKPLWVTEGNPAFNYNGGSLSPTDKFMQITGYVGQGMLRLAALGAGNFNYYYFEPDNVYRLGFELGDLANPSDTTGYTAPASAGYAYYVLSHMMAGTYVEDAYTNSGVTVVKLRQIGTDSPLYAVWSDTAQTLSLPTDWKPLFQHTQMMYGSQPIRTATYGGVSVPVVDLSPTPQFLIP